MDFDALNLHSIGSLESSAEGVSTEDGRYNGESDVSDVYQVHSIGSLDSSSVNGSEYLDGDAAEAARLRAAWGKAAPRRRHASATASIGTSSENDSVSDASQMNLHSVGSLDSPIEQPSDITEDSGDAAEAERFRALFGDGFKNTQGNAHTLHTRSRQPPESAPSPISVASYADESYETYNYSESFESPGTGTSSRATTASNVSSSSQVSTSAKTEDDSYGYSNTFESPTESISTSASISHSKDEEIRPTQPREQRRTNPIHHDDVPSLAERLGRAAITRLVLSPGAESAAVAAATSYKDPALLALNDLLRTQIEFTRMFVEANKRMASSLGDHKKIFRPTTLADTKEYIRRHRKPVMTMEEALREVHEEESYYR